MTYVRSTKGPDVADKVVDLGARQREIRHRAVWTCQERPELVIRHSAARDSKKSWRTLWNGVSGLSVDHMAIGAPLPRNLHAFLDVRPDGMRNYQSRYQRCQ
jgi:hypothetical protein